VLLVAWQGVLPARESLVVSFWNFSGFSAAGADWREPGLLGIYVGAGVSFWGESVVPLVFL